MTDLDKLSEEELLELLRKVRKDNPEEPYHPHSMMALAVASPEEARRITRERQTTFQKVFTFVILSFMAIVFFGLFVMAVTS